MAKKKMEPLPAGKMSVIKNLSVDPKELFDYFIKSKGLKEVIFFGPYYLNPTDKPKEISKEISNEKKLVRKALFSKYEWDINEGPNKVLASIRNGSRVTVEIVEPKR